jgi:hypothetical protein
VPCTRFYCLIWLRFATAEAHGPAVLALQVVLLPNHLVVDTGRAADWLCQEQLCLDVSLLPHSAAAIMHLARLDELHVGKPLMRHQYIFLVSFRDDPDSCEQSKRG